MDTFHPMIKKHLNKLTNQLIPRKLFIPMCGKAVDMAVLARMGHSVVGVEFYELAVQVFFNENNITCSKKCVPLLDGILYESDEFDLRVYWTNILQFNPKLENGFDGVCDRGGLESIDIPLRKKNANVLTSILSKGTNYLLDTWDRPPGIGPPYYIFQRKNL